MPLVYTYEQPNVHTYSSTDVSMSTLPVMPRVWKRLRSIKVGDSLWHAAITEAGRRGEYGSEAIRDMLRDYVDGKDSRAPERPKS